MKRSSGHEFEEAAYLASNPDVTVGRGEWRGGEKPAIYGSIQVMRGVAALMVFSSHLATLVSAPTLGIQSLGIQWDKGLEWFALRYHYAGPAGVDIFFVISGFIVTTTALRIAEGAGTAWQKARYFGLRRIFRIYPVYWVVLALAVLAGSTLELAPSDIPHHSIARLALLATTVNYKVMLAWTLCFEMYFYLVLAAILLFAPQAIFQGLAIWGLCFVALVFICWRSFPASMYVVFFSPLLIEFMYGCAIAWLASRGERRFGWQALAVGLALFIVAVHINMGVGQWQPKWRTATFGLAGAFFVYGLVSLETQRRFPLPKILERVGDASYSIYIWHQLVIAAVVWVTGKAAVTHFLPGPIWLIIWGVIALAVGFVSYHWIERPSVRWLNKRFASRPTAASVPLA